MNNTTSFDFLDIPNWMLEANGVLSYKLPRICFPSYKLPRIYFLFFFLLVTGGSWCGIFYQN